MGSLFSSLTPVIINVLRWYLDSYLFSFSRSLCNLFFIFIAFHSSISPVHLYSFSMFCIAVISRPSFTPLSSSLFPFHQCTPSMYTFLPFFLPSLLSSHFNYCLPSPLLSFLLQSRIPIQFLSKYFTIHISFLLHMDLLVTQLVNKSASQSVNLFLFMSICLSLSLSLSLSLLRHILPSGLPAKHQRMTK